MIIIIIIIIFFLEKNPALSGFTRLLYFYISICSLAINYQ